MKNITITNKTKELLIKQTITEKYIDDNGHELVNCGIFNLDSGKYEFIWISGINNTNIIKI